MLIFFSNILSDATPPKMLHQAPPSPDEKCNKSTIGRFLSLASRVHWVAGLKKRSLLVPPNCEEAKLSMHLELLLACNQPIVEWYNRKAQDCYKIYLFYFIRVGWHQTNYRTAGSLINWWVFFGGGVVFIPAARFEPGTAGYESRTPPLCYAVTPRLLQDEL